MADIKISEHFFLHDLVIRLSENFTLQEFVTSQMAVRHGINNTPPEEAIKNMKLLCVNVLEPLRHIVGKIRISSGYRCEKLNTLIGGAKNSEHKTGNAADISCNTATTEELFWIIKKSGLKVNQCIMEFMENGGWIHVSFAAKNKNQYLKATKVKGKTVYTTIK